MSDIQKCPRCDFLKKSIILVKEDWENAEATIKNLCTQALSADDIITDMTATQMVTIIVNKLKKYENSKGLSPQQLCDWIERHKLRLSQ